MIDRKTYLEMCQAVSVILGNRTANEIPESLLVVYDGHDYYPLAYSLSFDKNGKTVHLATIHDRYANSINGCLLSELNLKGDTNGSKNQ